MTSSKVSDALTSRIAKKFIVEFHPLSRVGDPPIEPWTLGRRTLLGSSLFYLVKVNLTKFSQALVYGGQSGAMLVSLISEVLWHHGLGDQFLSCKMTWFFSWNPDQFSLKRISLEFLNFTLSFVFVYIWAYFQGSTVTARAVLGRRARFINVNNIK